MGIGLVLSSQRLGDIARRGPVVYRELPGKPRLLNAVLADIYGPQRILKARSLGDICRLTG